MVDIPPIFVFHWFIFLRFLLFIKLEFAYFWKVKKTNGWYSSNIWIPFLSRLSWQASPLIMSFFPAMQKKQFWKINFVLFSILNWRWKTPAKETIFETTVLWSKSTLYLHIRINSWSNSGSHCTRNNFP